METAPEVCRLPRGILVAFLLLAACGDPASTGASDPASAEWSLEADPIGSVGLDESEPAEILTRVTGGRLLRDGGFVVLDRDTQELRAFTDSGSHLWTAGGRGEGPSEFGFAAGPGVMPDGSIAVPDLGAAKVVTFSRGGDFVRSDPVPADRSQWAGQLYPPMSGGSIPTMAFLQSVSSRPAPGLALSESTLRVVLIRSDAVETVFTSPGAQGFQRVEGGRLQGGPLPFGALAAMDSGWEILVVGNGQSDPVVIDERGDTARIPSPFPRLPVTGQLEDDYLSAHEADRDLLLEVLGTSAIPDSTPGYDRLWIDSQDRIWVRRYRVSPAMHDWAVLDRRGAVLGRLRLPLDAEFLDADRDRVLIRRETEFDVQFVEVYRFGDGDGGGSGIRP